jgi:hypothetical protein
VSAGGAAPAVHVSAGGAAPAVHVSAGGAAPAVHVRADPLFDVSLMVNKGDAPSVVWRCCFAAGML